MRKLSNKDKLIGGGYKNGLSMRVIARLLKLKVMQVEEAIRRVVG